MSEQEVKYTMSLQDLLSGKIKEADGHIQHMEGSLHHAATEAKSMGLEIAAAAGVAIGIAGIAEFVKEGAHEMGLLNQAQAQVRAGLESTREAAGLTFEELSEQAEKFSHTLKFSNAQVTDMQAQLLTFPAVTKETFGEASAAIMDMATRLHKGLDETAIQVGKALQDPIRGITALHKAGVNFSEEQKNVIKHLVATGQEAKAQQLILHELQTEFAGSAAAAAAADPLFRYKKIMEELHEKVGALAIKLQKALAPALEWIAKTATDAFHFFAEHKAITYALGIAVGVVAGGLLIYEGVMMASTIATKLATVAQWALNSAMLNNPVGIVITVISALVGVIVYLYNKFDWMRGGVYAAWEALKGLYDFIKDTLMSAFQGLGMMIHGVFHLDWNEIKSGWNTAIDGAAKAGLDYGRKIMEGYREGVASFAENPLEKGKGPKPILTPGKPGKDGPDGKSETGKATGAKNVTINIKIDNLIKEFKIQTTNLTEGATKIKEAVAQALLSAVNDSQVLAGQ